MNELANIMVVDDEADMVEILKHMLESHGHKVSTALSGEECIRKVVQSPPDILVLDIRMPGMDGWQVLKSLKEKKVTDKSKVLILTVEKGPGVEIFGLQDVVSDYLVKPFDKRQLLRVISSLED
ncbi:MAG: response regulator [Candidatus Altiarchaeota archaeon]